MGNMRAAAVLFAALLALSTSFAVPGSALAGDEDPYTALLDAAFDEYEAQRFQAALELFEDAADVRRTGEVLFNIGACHEYLGNPEEAVAALRESIELGISASLQDRARAKIRSLEARLAPEEPDGSGAQTGQPVEPGGQSSAADDPWHDKRRTLRGVGGAMLGGGAATLGVGGVLWGLAHNENVQFEAADDLDTKRGHMDAVGQFALAGDITAGIGAGVAVTGLVLSLVSCRCEAPGQRAGEVALVPAVLPLPDGGFAFVVAGEF